jgi:hypothetical protein
MIRFGAAKADDDADDRPLPDGGDPAAGVPATGGITFNPGSPALAAGGRELFVRHARKDGRLVAMLRAIDLGDSCVVEAEVYPHGSTQLTRPGPYTFDDPHQASAFVTEAVAALMYLGCDIQAQ